VRIAKKISLSYYMRRGAADHLRMQQVQYYSALQTQLYKCVRVRGNGNKFLPV